MGLLLLSLVRAGVGRRTLHVTVHMFCVGVITLALLLTWPTQVQSVVQKREPPIPLAQPYAAPAAPHERLERLCRAE